jgi:hypothetical protein
VTSSKEAYKIFSHLPADDPKISPLFTVLVQMKIGTLNGLQIVKCPDWLRFLRRVKHEEVSEKQWHALICIVLEEEEHRKVMREKGGWIVEEEGEMINDLDLFRFPVDWFEATIVVALQVMTQFILTELSIRKDWKAQFSKRFWQFFPRYCKTTK